MNTVSAAKGSLMRARTLIGTLAGFGMLFGCNAILNNQPGDLADGGFESDATPTATVDAGGNDATVLPPPADGGADTGPPAYDAGPVPDFDAGTIPTCALGEKLCNGACVAGDNPLFGCGPTVCEACALPHATPACGSSGCAIASCESGYADCDQNPANGCETDLSQAGHCGTCNAVCGSAEPDCAPSGGGFACATGCGGSAPTLCGTQCVDLQSSRDNCGACATACAAVANGASSCAQGHCTFSCDTDFHTCGSACASNLNPATCGASCAPCVSGAHSVATCDGTKCGLACQAGYADCDQMPADGCEVDLTSNTNNCGACGHSCGAGTCKNSQCVAPPPPPPPDAGPPPVDAAPPPQDSGAPPADAATQPSDASGD